MIEKLARLLGIGIFILVAQSDPAHAENSPVFHCGFALREYHGAASRVIREVWKDGCGRQRAYESAQTRCKDYQSVFARCEFMNCYQDSFAVCRW